MLELRSESISDISEYWLFFLLGLALVAISGVLVISSITVLLNNYIWFISFNLSLCQAEFIELDLFPRQVQRRLYVQ